MTSASQYAIGTPNYNAVLASQGKAAADAQWQAARIAEQNGTPLDTSFWDALGNQVYNDPFGAPLEQAGKVAGNTFSDLGDAVKNAAGKAIGNWGVWILGGLIVFGLFLYFGGGKVIRRKLS